MKFMKKESPAAMYDVALGHIDPINTGQPQITFDTKLGQHIDYIDVNYDKLTNYMTENSFTDEQIAESAFHIDSAIKFSSINNRNQHTFTHGEYNQDTDTITIYPIPSISINDLTADVDQTKDKQHFNAFERFLRTQSNQIVTQQMSKTLVHELEHKAVNVLEGGMPEAEKYLNQIYFKRGSILMAPYVGMLSITFSAVEISDFQPDSIADIAAASLFSGVAVAFASVISSKLHSKQRKNDHSNYLNNPEEKRCRQAEDFGPQDLLTVIAK